MDGAGDGGEEGAGEGAEGLKGDDTPYVELTEQSPRELEVNPKSRGGGSDL